MKAVRRLSRVSRYSWLVAVMPLGCLFYGLQYFRPTEAETVGIVLASLLLLWEFLASALTEYAIYRHREFAARASSLLSPSVTTAIIRPLALPGLFALVPGVLFATLGFFAVFYVSLPSVFHLFGVVTVVTAFYYAGTAFYAAVIATENARRVLRQAAGRAHNGVCDPDQLCGLGFVRRLADDISILILTGVLALPLGVFAIAWHVHRWIEAQPGGDARFLRTTSLLAAVVAIGVWLYFAASPTIRVRHHLQHVLARIKHSCILELKKKLEFVDDDGERQAVRAQIAEWDKVKTRLFLGLHAYRDMLSIVSSIALGVAGNVVAGWVIPPAASSSPYPKEVAPADSP